MLRHPVNVPQHLIIRKKSQLVVVTNIDVIRTIARVKGTHDDPLLDLFVKHILSPRRALGSHFLLKKVIETRSFAYQTKSKDLDVRTC